MNIPLQLPATSSTNIRVTAKTVLAPATIDYLATYTSSDETHNVENIETEIVTMEELIFD